MYSLEWTAVCVCQTVYWEISIFYNIDGDKVLKSKDVQFMLRFSCG